MKVGKSIPNPTPASKEDSESILELYREVMTALNTKPEGTDIAGYINVWINSKISFDFGHYLMDDLIPDHHSEKQVLTFDRLVQNTEKKFFSDVVNVRVTQDSDEGRFAELVERNKQKMITQRQELHPHKSRKYHYYEIQSSDEPKIIFGFFRHIIKDRDTSFTVAEKNRLESWKEDVFILLRAILLDLLESEPYKYFGSYFAICTKIASRYSLSASESRLLTEIAFGYTNEQIAERNFISVATVKKHLQNIFRKTDTKNRMDFIGRFFTSPTRVDF